MMRTHQFNNRVALSFCNRHGFQLVRDYLEQVDLNRFFPTGAPPITTSKQELMGFSTTDKLEEILAAAIQKNKVITVKWVKDMYGSEFDHGLSDMAIANALLSIGCQQRKTTTHRFYITPTGIDAGISTATAPKDLLALLPDGKF